MSMFNPFHWLRREEPAKQSDTPKQSPAGPSPKVRRSPDQQIAEVLRMVPPQLRDAHYELKMQEREDLRADDRLRSLIGGVIQGFDREPMLRGILEIGGAREEFLERLTSEATERLLKIMRVHQEEVEERFPATLIRQAKKDLFNQLFRSFAATESPTQSGELFWEVLIWIELDIADQCDKLAPQFHELIGSGAPRKFDGTHLLREMLSLEERGEVTVLALAKERVRRQRRSLGE